MPLEVGTGDLVVDGSGFTVGDAGGGSLMDAVLLIAGVCFFGDTATMGGAAAVGGTAPLVLGAAKVLEAVSGTADLVRAVLVWDSRADSGADSGAYSGACFVYPLCLLLCPRRRRPPRWRKIPYLSVRGGGLGSGGGG